MIQMFKAHYLQKTCCAVSMKCDVSLDELKKAAHTPEKTEVNVRRTWCGVIRHWWSYTIRDAIWYARDA